MKQERQDNHAKKQDKSSSQNNADSTTNPKIPKVLTRENIEKARIAVRNSGKIGSCDSILNANPSTILKWRKKFPKFGQAISQALEEHKVLTKKEHPELYTQAIANLNILLQDREMHETRVTTDKSIDSKTGEVIFINERTTVRTFTREPTWPAIEKILGKEKLTRILHKTLNKTNKIQKHSIVKKMFGTWMESDELGARWNGSIFNDMLDLMLIRTLQAETRRLYENGDLEYKEYNKIILDQTKHYGALINNREKRAIKLLKGHSYVEIVDFIQSYLQTIINTVDEVSNDHKIERKGIANEVIEKVQSLPGIQGFTAWSDYQNISRTKSKKEKP